MFKVEDLVHVDTYSRRSI